MSLAARLATLTDEFLCRSGVKHELVERKTLQYRGNYLEISFQFCKSCLFRNIYDRI